MPSSKFEELATSIDRHGTLYRCLDCGDLFELIEEARSIQFTPRAELERYYPVLQT